MNTYSSLGLGKNGNCEINYKKSFFWEGREGILEDRISILTNKTSLLLFQYDQEIISNWISFWSTTYQFITQNEVS